MQLPAPPLLLHGTATPHCSKPQQMAGQAEVTLDTNSLAEAENAASTMYLTVIAVMNGH